MDENVSPNFIIDLVLKGGPPWGFRIKEKNNTVIISKINCGGRAYKNGLKVNDEIVAVNNLEIDKHPLTLARHPEDEENKEHYDDLQLSKLDFTYQLIKHTINRHLHLKVKRNNGDEQSQSCCYPHADDDDKNVEEESKILINSNENNGNKIICHDINDFKNINERENCLHQNGLAKINPLHNHLFIDYCLKKPNDYQKESVLSPVENFEAQKCQNFQRINNFNDINEINKIEATTSQFNEIGLKSLNAYPVNQMNVTTLQPANELEFTHVTNPVYSSQMPILENHINTHQIHQGLICATDPSGITTDHPLQLIIEDHSEINTTDLNMDSSPCSESNSELYRNFRHRPHKDIWSPGSTTASTGSNSSCDIRSDSTLKLDSVNVTNCLLPTDLNISNLLPTKHLTNVNNLSINNIGEMNMVLGLGRLDLSNVQNQSQLNQLNSNKIQLMNEPNELVEKLIIQKPVQQNNQQEKISQLNFQPIPNYFLANNSQANVINNIRPIMLDHNNNTIGLNNAISENNFDANKNSSKNSTTRNISPSTQSETSTNTQTSKKIGFRVGSPPPEMQFKCWTLPRYVQQPILNRNNSNNMNDNNSNSQFENRKSKINFAFEKEKLDGHQFTSQIFYKNENNVNDILSQSNSQHDLTNNQHSTTPTPNHNFLNYYPMHLHLEQNKLPTSYAKYVYETATHKYFTIPASIAQRGSILSLVAPPPSRYSNKSEKKRRQKRKKFEMFKSSSKNNIQSDFDDSEDYFENDDDKIGLNDEFEDYDEEENDENEFEDDYDEEDEDNEEDNEEDNYEENQDENDYEIVNANCNKENIENEETSNQNEIDKKYNKSFSELNNLDTDADNGENTTILEEKTKFEISINQQQDKSNENEQSKLLLKKDNSQKLNQKINDPNKKTILAEKDYSKHTSSNNEDLKKDEENENLNLKKNLDIKDKDNKRKKINRNFICNKKSKNAVRKANSNVKKNLSNKMDKKAANELLKTKLRQAKKKFELVNLLNENEKKYPGKIADYMPGKSSVSTKEKHKFYANLISYIDSIFNEVFSSTESLSEQYQIDGRKTVMSMGRLEDIVVDKNKEQMRKKRQQQLRNQQRLYKHNHSILSKNCAFNVLVSDDTTTNGYESDSSYIIRKREPIPAPVSRSVYSSVQKGEDIPFEGFRRSFPYIRNHEENFQFRKPLSNLRDNIQTDQYNNYLGNKIDWVNREINNFAQRNHHYNFSHQDQIIPLNRYKYAAASKSATELSKALLAKVLFDFRALTGRELSVKKEDIVIVIRPINHNWVEVEDIESGLRGLVPRNYLDYEQEGLAKAKYDFDAKTNVELSFKKDEILKLLRKVDQNWFEGISSKGQKGILPNNHVEILRLPLSFHYDNRFLNVINKGNSSNSTAQPLSYPRSSLSTHQSNSSLRLKQIGSFPNLSTDPQAESNDSSTHPPQPPLPNNSFLRSSSALCQHKTYSQIQTTVKDHFAQKASLAASAPHLPVDDNDKKSELPELTQNIPNSNHQPSHNIHPIQSNFASTTSLSTKSTISQLPNDNFVFRKSNPSYFKQLMPNPRNLINTNKHRSLIKRLPIHNINENNSTSNNHLALKKLYRVLYPYKPQQIDELELYAGDILSVSMHCDDGWYVGHSTLTGYYGTFPGNYVEPLM